MTTVVEPRKPGARAASLAVSEAFGVFAIVFAITAPVIYVVSELAGLPLFTYHPGTNRVDFGWAAARANEGPAMYWYGWIGSMLFGSTVMGLFATLLPRRVSAKIPLALIWIMPLLALPVLAYVLMPFWTR
jgi:hypothetical protein